MGDAQVTMGLAFVSDPIDEAKAVRIDSAVSTTLAMAGFTGRPIWRDATTNDGAPALLLYSMGEPNHVFAIRRDDFRRLNVNAICRHLREALAA